MFNAIKNFLKKTRNPLSTESLKFSYSDQQVLKDITLNLKEGKITAIIGKSGCGKSTFLKLISGVISRKYGGKIKIYGRSRAVEQHEIGFVPQEVSMIPDLSIENNIKISGLNLGIPESVALEKASSLLKLLKFEEDLEKMPSQLSGGQRVRLNIILSILHDPTILIFDEPFVGLDFQNRKLLWHFLESMKKKGKSIILTSHLLSETQEHADRFVILQDGKIFFNGKVESLKHKLKMKFIMETRFTHLSKEAHWEIKRYCDYRDIKILDSYEKYMMFALSHSRTGDALENFFDKLNLKYDIISIREPNLDEVFLKT